MQKRIFIVDIQQHCIDGFTNLFRTNIYIFIMTNKCAALFDLDGVLVDTESIYTEFWDSIDKQYPTGIENFALFIKGNTLGNILNKYFPDKNVQEQIISMLKEHERTMKYQLFESVLPFLDKLCSAGIGCAIVTSSNKIKMEHLFAQIPGFKEYFDAIITEENVTRSKPDPQGYLTAAKALGCEPEDCYVFEDSLAGLEAGRRSGAKVVALATTNPRELLIDKADIIIDDFKELSVNTHATNGKISIVVS